MEAVAVPVVAPVPVKVPVDAEDVGGIEWPGGLLEYDATTTTPISRWAAYISFRVASWMFGWSLALVSRWHPWHIFHEGQMRLRQEALWHLPMRGLVHFGPREPRYVTTVKLVALLSLAYVALSFLFDLGRVDLFGFDLIHLGTDL